MMANRVIRPNWLWIPLALGGCNFLPQSQPSETQSPSVDAQQTNGIAPAPAALAPAAPPQDAPLRPQGTVVEQPDEETIALIYFSFAGGAPIDEWVSRDVAASNVDEFSKQDLAKQRSAKLREMAAAAGRVGRFTLPVRSELSEYDERYGEYYLGLFGGTSTLSYQYRGQSYNIEFVNKDKAQAWKVPADEAKHIFERNGRSRAIIVTARVEIVGFSPKSDGGTLKVRVVSYLVDSESNDTRLGSVVVR